MQPATSPRDPLILRLLLQVIRPETVQVNVHRWVAMTTAILFAYLLWGNAYFTDWHVFVGASVFMLGSASTSTVITAYLTGQTYRRYPEPSQSRRRLAVNTLCMVAMGIVLTTSGLWMLNAVHLFGFHYTPRQGMWIVLLSVLLDLLLVGFFEITFAFRQWQTNELEVEQLSQHQLQNQLTELKQQVNPHFLFNSLSSLSVLISEDPTQAERFVDELAQVYRYLLQAHRHGQQPLREALVPLEAELRFLHAYAYLLCTRYGTGLTLHLAPIEAYPAGTLLPLTLQTLVDNAIRHNVLSVARPLCITVEPAPGGVRVRNSVHKRTQRVPQAHQSLAKLQAHYQLLGDGDAVQVEADAECFSVVVPLLNF